LAEEFGINEKDFSNCVDSDEIKNKIENSWQEAYDSGINATPAIFIQIKSAGKSYKAIPGKNIIDNAIQSYLKNN
jgi:predicted DsbA family dithiol-disulfide isomerase